MPRTGPFKEDLEEAQCFGIIDFKNHEFDIAGIEGLQFEIKGKLSLLA